MRYDTDTERQQMEVEIEWHQRMGFSHIGSYMAKLEWSEAQLLGFVMSFQSMALVNATKLLRYVISLPGFFFNFEGSLSLLHIDA